MARIESKQIRKVLASSIKITGQAVTASSSSVNVTSTITSALTTAGNGGTSVPLLVSTDFQTAGIVATSPINRCEVYDNTTKKKITTIQSEEVYGRITFATSTYTLSFYYITSAGGVETPYIFSANQNIDFDFNYRFEFYQLPSDSIVGQFARNVYQDPRSNGGNIFMLEQLTVSGINSVSPLSTTPNDATKVTLLVNGQTVDALGGGAASFNITGGVNINWVAANAGYSLETTDRVIASYYV